MTHETLRFVLLLTLLAAMLPACTATRTFPAEPHDKATPTGAIPSNYLWDSDADLASGVFYNTRVVSGTGRVTLAQTPVWSPSVRVDDAPSGKQFSPSLAVGPDGTFYAAWHDDRNGDYDIYFARSRDGGATWSPNVRVDDAPSGSQLYPSLAVGPDGTLYAAWHDSRYCDLDIFHDCDLVYANRDIYAAQYSDRYGRYTAAPVDAGMHVVWETFACTATLPAGTGITLTARVGESPTPDARWSAWVTLGGSPADLDHGDNRAVLRVTEAGGLYAEQSFVVGPARVYLSLVFKNAR